MLLSLQKLQLANTGIVKMVEQIGELSNTVEFDIGQRRYYDLTMTDGLHVGYLENHHFSINHMWEVSRYRGVRGHMIGPAIC